MSCFSCFGGRSTGNAPPPGLQKESACTNVKPAASAVVQQLHQPVLSSLNVSSPTAKAVSAYATADVVTPSKRALAKGSAKVQGRDNNDSSRHARDQDQGMPELPKDEVLSGVFAPVELAVGAPVVVVPASAVDHAATHVDDIMFAAAALDTTSSAAILGLDTSADVKDVKAVRFATDLVHGQADVSNSLLLLSSSAILSPPPAELNTAAAAVPAFHSTAPLQVTADFAAALSSYTGGADVAAVEAYLASMGPGVGRGLLLAAGTDATAGHIFGAAYKLHVAAGSALVNRSNCFKLQQLGHDVVVHLDAAGKRDPALQPALLALLLERLNAATDIVVPYTSSGWLLHVVCNERQKETFDNAHNAIVDAAAALPSSGSARPLPRGDYRDVSKAVRRMVKQCGSGNLTQGLKALKVSTDPAGPVRELARLLEVDVPAAQAELTALPALDMDVQALYANFVLTTPAQRSELHREAFMHYDADGSGAIEPSELRAALADAGLLDGKSFAESEAIVSANFRLADKQGAGALTLPEFAAWFETLTIGSARARTTLRSRMGLQAEEDLKQVFITFSAFGSTKAVELEMDNVHFMKLTRDCGLLSKELDNTSVDIIFTKVKTRGQRRITFDQFVTALALCAEKAGSSLEAFVRQVLAAGGPETKATRAESVRLHDDRSTYTGVYAKGGPSNVEVSKDLSALLDRSDADVRGVKRGGVSAVRSSLSSIKPITPNTGTKTAGAPSASPASGLRSSRQNDTWGNSRQPGAWARRSMGPVHL